MYYWRRNSDESENQPYEWQPPDLRPPIPLIAKDWEGVHLTADTIYEINHLLERVASGAYSRSFIQELYSMGNQRFQQAYREGNQATMDEIGPQIQALNHVLHVAFDGGSVKPDPKHLDYLDYLEQQQRVLESDIGEIETIEDTVEDTVAGTEGMEIAEDELAFIDPDLRASIEPLSSDPEIAELQNQVRRLSLNLREEMEDHEPMPVIRATQRKLARVHEKLIKLLDNRRNPWFY